MTVQYCYYSCDAFFSIPFLSWHCPYTGKSIPPTLDPILWSTFFEMLGVPPGGWHLTGPAVPFSPEPGHFWVLSSIRCTWLTISSKYPSRQCLGPFRRVWLACVPSSQYSISLVGFCKNDTDHHLHTGCNTLIWSDTLGHKMKNLKFTNCPINKYINMSFYPLF